MSLRGTYWGERMNNKANNMTTNKITNMTTNQEFGREQPGLQLAERVVERHVAFTIETLQSRCQR